MAKKNSTSSSKDWPRTESGPKTSIVVVIHSAGGHLYLAPKPGGERAKKGRQLALVVVNLTTDKRRVEIEFDSRIEGKPRGRLYRFTVPGPGMDHQVAMVRDSIFDDVPPWENVITVPYTVWVDGHEIDPDLEIER